MKQKKELPLIECYVVWFDRLSGDGIVRCLASDRRADIFACNIKGKRTWFPETACVYYGVGQIVQVQQDSNGFVIGVTPGEFDAEKWNRLDHDRLAFKCDTDGNATNGLFA